MTNGGIAITGASGFIGWRLVSHLRALGRPVRVLLRDGSKAPPFHALGCQVVRGDITVPESLPAAVAGCESIVHLARGGSELEDSRRVNVKGTLDLLAAARDGGVRRVVYLSTVVAHGRRWPAVLTEEFPLCTAGDPYGVTKAESERAGAEFARQAGLDLRIVRPTIVYGPGSPRVISDYERVRYERVTLIDGGRGLLNLVFIDDLIDGIGLVESSPAAAGEAFLLSGAAPVTVRDYLGQLARLAGKPPPRAIGRAAARAYAFGSRWHYRLTREARRLADEDFELMGHHEAVSIAKAERLLGYAPRFSLEDGMRRTGSWLADLGYAARPAA